MKYPSTNTSIVSSGLGKWIGAPATEGQGDGGGGSGVEWRLPAAVRPCTTAL